MKSYSSTMSGMWKETNVIDLEISFDCFLTTHTKNNEWFFLISIEFINLKMRYRQTMDG